MTRLNLPLPWELGQINVYLLPYERGWMLVDCGISTPECFSAVETELRKAEIPWSAISLILLTHVHPDHMGLAPKLLSLTGARLAVHPVEHRHLDEIIEGAELGFELARTPQDLRKKIGPAFRKVRQSFVPLTPDVLLDDGQRIGPARVVHTPGHSPGHVCLLLLDDGSLISGDHLLEKITPNIGWISGEDALGDYLQSLGKVADLNVTRVYPAHGEPFDDHRAWIAATIAHHEERCSAILEALDGRPRTAHDMVAVLWPRELSAFHYRFAVYEALAHLEYMRRRSQVVLGADGLWASHDG